MILKPNKLLGVYIKCNIIRFVLHLSPFGIMIMVNSATEFQRLIGKLSATELFMKTGG